ncbi:hypothetical protein WJX79_006618 [Trebouxia sp. C0005]
MVSTSFLDVFNTSHFSLQNLPYGIFAPSSGGTKRVGVALGSNVIDLAALSNAGLFSGAHLQQSQCFSKGTLNTFMSMGRGAWTEARTTLTRLLSDSEGALRDNEQLRKEAVIPLADVTLYMPANIGDYTDFYASKEHASNCGTMFRGKGNELNANWVHLPIAYHGRSSSVVVSGTPVHRPRGQVKPDGASVPEYSPCQTLDFELEMAAFIGPGNDLGSAISTAEASDHVFGMVLMNDWSARDIQKWETVPLGPFTGKNWATSISPWVVTMDALEPFRCAAPVQDPPVLEYLQEASRSTYDITLKVSIQPEGSPEPSVITQSNLKHLYWTVDQMVAHHTYTGCNLRPGDLLGTGTISSDAKNGLGSLLEASWQGTRQVALNSGQQRTFIEDGDTITLTGYCQGDSYRVGFGECSGKVLPAK